MTGSILLQKIKIFDIINPKIRRKPMKNTKKEKLGGG